MPLGEKDTREDSGPRSFLCATGYNQAAGMRTQHPQDMATASRTQSSQQATHMGGGPASPGKHPSPEIGRRAWKSTPRNLLFLVSGKRPQWKRSCPLGRVMGSLSQEQELACASLRGDGVFWERPGQARPRGASTNSRQFWGLTQVGPK